MTSEREWDMNEGDVERDGAPESPELAGAEPPAEESNAATPGSDRRECESPVREDAGAVSEGDGVEKPDQPIDGEGVRKRFKRSKRKELLDLIERKNGMLMELDRQLKNAKQDIAKKEDRLLRLAAEFENYKKRTRGEQELLKKTASADLIKEIIWGIDNFDRAFANLGGAEDHIQEGIRLIHAGLMDILTKAGLKEIEAQGRDFDARYHEAVGEIESDVEEGRVAQVMQRGYTLHDQVLRPARVLVSRKKQ